MLDSYKPGISSQDELDLIKELHQSCERLKLNVFKLAAETPQNEEMLRKCNRNTVQTQKSTVIFF